MADETGCKIPERFHAADVNMAGLQQWKSIDQAFFNLAKSMTKAMVEAGFPNVVISYHNIRDSVRNPDNDIGTWDIVVHKRI